MFAALATLRVRRLGRTPEPVSVDSKRGTGARCPAMLGRAAGNELACSKPRHALASARACWGRSTGDLARQRSMRREISGSTPGTVASSGMCGQVQACTMMPWPVSPWNGTSPRMASYIITPIDQMSDAGPASRALVACSGLM